ncbi:hypothetical protein GCM10025859_40320 [Alicyclobacillus fastidiosus]|nr:hypothetical protein GCM10025859_40320 [Alicyclobacillus fastidiosus]
MPSAPSYTRLANVCAPAARHCNRIGEKFYAEVRCNRHEPDIERKRSQPERACTNRAKVNQKHHVEILGGLWKWLGGFL